MPTTRVETLAFAQSASWRFSAERDLSAPPEIVFAALADASTWPEWFPLLHKADWVTPPPHGVGSERWVKVGPTRVDERFIAWDDNQRIAFTFTAATLPVVRAGVEVIELEPSGTGTRARYTMALEPPAGIGALRAVVAPGVRWTLQRALTGLDEHLRS